MKSLTLLCLILGFSMVADAGKRKRVHWDPDRSWNPNSQYGRLYDTRNVEKVSGEIIEVEEARPMSRMRSGVHLKVKSGKESLTVHLGPGWYILNQDMKLQKGDRVDIKGARISISGGTALVAAQVKKGDSVMQLRDENGTPYWCAGCLPHTEKF